MAFPRHSLPFDVCSEVLSWLPAKEVAKSRLVSKQINEEASKLFFCLAQSRHASSTGLILRGHFDSFELSFLDSSAGVPSTTTDLLRNTRIIGSENGLIICQNHCWEINCDILVYNIARGTFIPLPPYNNPEPLRDSPLLGVAVSFVGDVDYELIFLRSTDWTPYYECSMYSSKQRKWKELHPVHVGPRDVQLDCLVLCRRTLYMAPYIYSKSIPISSEFPYIVSYDIDEGCSGKIRVPAEVLDDDHPCISIAKWSEDSICLIYYHNRRFTIWRLEEEEWVKIGKVDARSCINRKTNREYSNQIVRSFTVLNREILVFGSRKIIYECDLKRGRKPKKLARHGQNCFTLFPYANTLRPCGLDEQRME